MSTEEPNEAPSKRRRVEISDAFQAVGLAAITTGAALADLAAGFVVGGVALLWIGWSQS